MGWVSEDGRHEGWIAPLFGDGQRGRGTTGGATPHDRVVVGPEVEQPDGSWAFPTRAAAEVVGWVITCEHDPADGEPWTGPTFTRVPSQALEDVPGLSIYAADEEVSYVSERDDVDEVARKIWRDEHTEADEILWAVAKAGREATAARNRLDDLVLQARLIGLPWQRIGAVLGMSRQSAHERWRNLERTTKLTGHSPSGRSIAELVADLKESTHTVR